ncbi:MAG: hypothetical protein AAF138_03110 [Planctomycetota bacterium]
MTIEHRRLIALAGAAACTLGALAACDTSGSEGETNTDTTTDSTTDSTSTSSEAPQNETAQGAREMVELTAATAADRGLPPARIEVDVADTGLSVFPNPADNTYVQLSGPPGGPLGATFERVTAQATEAGMRSLAELRFEGQSPSVGTFEMVNFAGAERPAITCGVGEGPGAEHHLLVLMPRPEGDTALLFDFYTDGGGATPTPSAMLADERYAAMFASVTVQFE